jgi:hypothetical protein
MTSTTETKLRIIENFIDYYTSSDEERARLKDIAADYVEADHVDEIDDYNIDRIRAFNDKMKNL